MKHCSYAALAGCVVVALAGACGSSDADESSRSSSDAGIVHSENTGQSCKVATDCYPEVEAGALAGEVQCLDRVTGGYCTHLCKTDADCCAVPGECKGAHRQVCSPFESTGQMMCFLSCEDEDIRDATDGGIDSDGGPIDSTVYCTTYASAAFKCRSSGGGTKNRKVCVP
ncbi:MAG TPA: hypothetical protein VM580_30300 [Labilithrix sp.]|jgi:hypothetical protein|nr:hypothetical protein [Labilithrix sp.]